MIISRYSTNKMQKKLEPHEINNKDKLAEVVVALGGYIKENPPLTYCDERLLPYSKSDCLHALLLTYRDSDDPVFLNAIENVVADLCYFIPSYEQVKEELTKNEITLESSKKLLTLREIPLESSKKSIIFDYDDFTKERSTKLIKLLEPQISGLKKMIEDYTIGI